MSESLQEYLAAKREENFSKRQRRLTIPITGYEDRFAGRYRILEFPEQRDIRQRHENLGEQEDGAAVVDAGADLILAANEDLLEITDPGDPNATPPVPATYQSLGKRWTAPAIGELFGVNITDPTGQTITARDALKLVLAPDQIVQHWGRVNGQIDQILTESEASVQGEAEPSSEG